MRKLIVFCCLIFCVCALQSKERVVKHPSFETWNSTTIEIDKVVQTDTATVLHIKAFFRPKNWIQISPDSYLKDDKGIKYAIKGGLDITLGKYLWMPESGERDFQLFFPPMPSSVKSFDFIESDCSDCFKIWGIQLKGKKLPKVQLPKEIVNQQLDFNAPLPTTEIKSGKAIISGRLLGYRGDMQTKVSIGDVLSCEYRDIPLKIEQNGNFKLEIETLIPTTVDLFVGKMNIAVCVAPGEESKVYVNLQEFARRQSRLRKDEPKQGQAACFGGYMAAVNTEIAETGYDINLVSYDNTLMEDINEKTLEECKAYFLNKYAKKLAEIQSLPIGNAYRQILRTGVDLSFVYCLAACPSIMKSAYVANNKLDDEAAQAYFREKKIDIPIDFYKCLNECKSLNTSSLFYTQIYLLRWANSMPNAQKVFSEVFGTDRGIFFQLSVAQKYGIQLTNFVPISKDEITEMSNQIYPSLLTELLKRNTNLIAQIEKNKQKTGYTVNATGEVNNEDLFYSIISKFKGKVILVDIWATWCGPCRMAMKQMLPMKEALKDKDIVYIYIADESSPLKTWENMIVDIHGEHFRLKSSQWEYLRKELHAGGVPTYLVIDKEGDIIYKTEGFPGVDAMKTELLKAFK